MERVIPSVIPLLRCPIFGYAVAAAPGRSLLVRPRVKRALDWVCGIVLIGLGARLALESRR